mmetsp:Transcript_7160/g.10265  ORF Transcript_7160/g.10265 Transcript_7160/m.10265 type:complete len:90 (+) Transcript_7160:1178-1447(+)
MTISVDNSNKRKMEETLHLHNKHLILLDDSLLSLTCKTVQSFLVVKLDDGGQENQDDFVKDGVSSTISFFTYSTLDKDGEATARTRALD